MSEYEIMQYKAVFLDRDGTIIENIPYLDDPIKLQLKRGVAEGIFKLSSFNFRIIVVSNQSGIARGYFSEKTLNEIHEKMRDMLSQNNAYIDDIYYCPHHPDESCNCRKPNTGLFEKAVLEHFINLRLSFMVGDRMLDIESGNKMGCKTVLVPDDTELAEKELLESHVSPDFIADSFLSAVDWILKNTS